MRAPSLSHALLLVATISGSTALCSRARAANDSYYAVSASSASEPRVLWPRFVINLPASYTLQAGATFDGHHGYVVQSGEVVHVPKLGGGFGVLPRVGVYQPRWLPNFGLMGLVDVGWSHHSAKSYNAGSVGYTRDSSTLLTTSLEVRVLLESMPVKPFVALAPGYGWLNLPNGVTIVDPVTRVTHWEDIKLRGFNFAAALGAMYPFNDVLSAEASVGCRWQGYTASSKGQLSGLGMSPALLANLGLVLMF